MSGDLQQLIDLFDAKAENFSAQTERRFQTLLPFKQGIARLREKHASSRVIADLLKQLGVSVSHNTIARFCREHLAPAAKPDAARPTATPPATRIASSAGSSVTETLRLRHQKSPSPMPPPTEPRGRGPRIADPKNV